MSSRGHSRALGRALALVSAGAVSIAVAAVALAADTTNDPGYADQWALTGSPASIHAPQAWCANLGNVLVADVDSGADFGHHDLAGKLVAGAAFTNGNGDPNSPDGTGQAAVEDDDGHGTMTTGIMVANTNNGVGIAGVAPAAKALIVRVLHKDTTPGDANYGKAVGYPKDVAAGIRYAAANGAKVINLSVGGGGTALLPDLGLPGSGDPVNQAITAVWASGNGALVVAASGNDGKQSVYAPVAANALVAGALGPRGEVPSYSSPGQNVSAPGGDSNGSPTVALSVLSTDLGNAYAVGDGTSFAAPMVAGTAAMLFSRPGATAASVRQKILDTVNRGLGNPQLDAAAALDHADNGPICPPPATGNPSGSGIVVKQSAPPKRAPVAARPATAPPVAAVPSPTPSPSPSPSASPVVAQDVMPSPKTLAHPPAHAPSQGPPAVAIVGGLAAVGAAGFGGIRLLQAVR